MQDFSTFLDLENISQDLEEIIGNLNSRKALGFDDINFKLIKWFESSIITNFITFN